MTLNRAGVALGGGRQSRGAAVRILGQGSRLGRVDATFAIATHQRWRKTWPPLAWAYDLRMALGLHKSDNPSGFRIVIIFHSVLVFKLLTGFPWTLTNRNA